MPDHLDPHSSLPHDHGSSLRRDRILAEKPRAESFESVANTFSLISDSTRLMILWLLCHSEECVTNIAAAIGMSAPAVSHHLRILKQAGLLVSKRSGRETLYTLADTEEAALVHKIVDSTFDIKCKV